MKTFETDKHKETLLLKDGRKNAKEEGKRNNGEEISE